MICSKCGHVFEHEQGAITECPVCGAALAPPRNEQTGEASASSASIESAATGESSPEIGTEAGSSGTSAPGGKTSGDLTWKQVKESQAFQQGAEISKQYGGFFLNALLQPLASSKKIDRAHFLNGIITMVIIAILLPLVLYIPSLRSAFPDSFGAGYLRPFILVVLAFAVAVFAAYGVMRLGKVAADPRDITAKLGTLLVPSTAALLISVVFQIIGLGIGLSGLFLFITVLSFFVAITLLIHQEMSQGNSASATALDPLYASLIVNVLFGYILYRIVLVSISYMLGGFFGL